MCTGLLDGKSALEIQTEHPVYQIFNLTNFPNNVSHLQSKLGLESAATVTFSSPQVVPSHSPPPSFVQAYPCLDRFHPSGHLKLELPYIMDEWSDGEHSFLSFQIAQLAGPPMKWYVSTDGKSLIGDYKASRNLVMESEKCTSRYIALT